jgi:hypothetical protein
MDELPQATRPCPPGQEAVESACLRQRTVALAWTCLLAVYLVGVTGRWWPTEDSAIYLGLARSLAAGEGCRFNGQFDSTFAPGLPLVLAGLRWLAGPGFWAVYRGRHCLLYRRI